MRYYESVAQFGSIRLCMHHLFLFCLWLAMVSIVGLTSLICVIYRLMGRVRKKRSSSSS